MQIPIENYEFFQKIRSDAFKKITRRSMNQWRIILGLRRGTLDDKTYRYLWNVTQYHSENTDGREQCLYLGISPPEHADDIREWIQSAHTFDELDSIRFRLNNYQYLRAKRK